MTLLIWYVLGYRGVLKTNNGTGSTTLARTFIGYGLYRFCFLLGLCLVSSRPQLSCMRLGEGDVTCFEFGFLVGVQFGNYRFGKSDYGA